MATFTKNYFGRNVDIYVMDFPEPSFEGEAGLTFQGSKGGKVTAGIEKLAQIYVITLFTAVGSKVLDPTSGTILGTQDIGTSNAGGRQVLQHVINISHTETVEQILTEQGDIVNSGLEVLPQDEILVSATLLGLTIESCDSASFSVLLTAASGDSTTFLVPLTLVP